MGSVLAVISKKVFERDARAGGALLGLGKVWPTEIYRSTHASLEPLRAGGHLFLVTVRPPDEALWLVAVLRDVKSVADGWQSSPNATRAVDITSLRGTLRFVSGAGITAAKGKLGMSLQTPRALTDDDVTALFAAAGGTSVAATLPAARVPAKVYHLNPHDPGPMPCLCARCLSAAGERVKIGDEAFVRREARAKDRVLYYWLPEVLLATENSVKKGVLRRMSFKLDDVIVHKTKPTAGLGDVDDEDAGDEDY